MAAQIQTASPSCWNKEPIPCRVKKIHRKRPPRNGRQRCCRPLPLGLLYPQKNVTQGLLRYFLGERYAGRVLQKHQEVAVTSRYKTVVRKRPGVAFGGRPVSLSRGMNGRTCFVFPFVFCFAYFGSGAGLDSESDEAAARSRESAQAGRRFGFLSFSLGNQAGFEGRIKWTKGEQTDMHSG